MTTSQPDDLWRCAECGVHYPIQPLARDCEARHAREEAQDAAAH